MDNRMLSLINQNQYQSNIEFLRIEKYWRKKIGAESQIYDICRHSCVFLMYLGFGEHLINIQYTANTEYVEPSLVPVKLVKQYLVPCLLCQLSFNIDLPTWSSFT